MPERTPQTLANHARNLPAYHFVAMPILLVYLLYTAYEAIAHFGLATVMAFAAAFALALVALLARVMANTVQDRVIRLEERLRMRDLLPADLQPRIQEFTPGQLVALRFASDAELPALARKVLDDRIDDRKAIKQMVKQWRPDYLRA